VRTKIGCDIRVKKPRRHQRANDYGQHSQAEVTTLIRLKLNEGLNENKKNVGNEKCEQVKKFVKNV